MFHLLSPSLIDVSERLKTFKNMSMKYKPNLYDSDPRDFLREEIDFYVELIKIHKPEKVLELGVGTGRIFKELLNLVDYAVGIDNSDEMLSVCERKCIYYDNYKLIHDNFVSFRLNLNFDFIYLPFNTFQHILHKKDQIKCLKNIWKHLNIDGIFILDVMNGKNVEFKLNEWKNDYSVKLENENILERFQNTLRIDENNVIHKQFKYIEYDKNKNIVNAEIFDALMKITPNDELRNLIRDCGFEIVDIWNNYQFGKDSNTKKVIYCLKKYENQ